MTTGTTITIDRVIMICLQRREDIKGKKEDLKIWTDILRQMMREQRLRKIDTNEGIRISVTPYAIRFTSPESLKRMGKGASRV